MRKALIVALVSGLIAGALVGPAVAKKKAKPQAVTLYLHGTLPAEEPSIPDRWLNNIWPTLDPTEPSGQSKSQMITNYVGGPNTNCSGNGLLPVWRGNLTGQVKGDVKFTLTTAAVPTTAIVASLYPDGTGGCNESAEAPAAQIQVDLAAGQAVTEIVFEDVDFEAIASLVLMLHIPNLTPGQARIFYDGADAPSSLEFLCTPTTQKTCV